MSTITTDSTLLSPTNPQPRRGHAHRRSAAISGDFDSMGISFFNSSTVASPKPYKLLLDNKENEYVLISGVATMVPNADFSFPNVENKSSNAENKNNTVSIRKSDISLSTKYSVDSLSNEVSSTETTPENSGNNEYGNNHSGVVNADELNNRLNSLSAKYYLSAGAVLNEKSDVPEAIIDLDAALDFNFEEKSTKSKRFHRRTESAPEFMGFFNTSPPISNSKLSINTGNGLGLYNSAGNRKSLYGQLSPTTDTAIVEEEEEEGEQSSHDDDSYQQRINPLSKKPSIYSNTFSTSLASLTKESTSLHSETSTANSTDELRKLSSPSPKFGSILQPPAPIGSRRGRTAARYQNYYDNSKLIIDALRSTESLTMKNDSDKDKDVNHKMSLPILSPTVSSALKNPANTKCVKTSKSLSPTRFSFEPIVYDVPEKPLELLKTYQEKTQEFDNTSFASQADPYETNKDLPGDPGLRHRKSHSISVSATDDFSAKISRPEKTRFKRFGSTGKNLDKLLDPPPDTCSKPHKRKSFVFNSLQHLLHSSKKDKNTLQDSEFDALISSPTLRRIKTHSRNNSRNSIAHLSLSGESISTAKIDKNSIIQTPVKRNSRLASSSSTNLHDESQLSAQTLTQSSQADLTIIHPSVQRKVSAFSLISESRKNTSPINDFANSSFISVAENDDPNNTSTSSSSRNIIDNISSSYGSVTPKTEARSLFKINTKSSLSLSLNNILKTPKRKVSLRHLGDTSFGSLADNSSVRSSILGTKRNNKRSSKILNWIRGKSTTNLAESSV